MSRKCSVLIVDDHAGFRALARRRLESSGWEIAGEAVDGDAALAAVQELAPDVVLLDIQLPGIDGFEVARRLRAEAGAPSVVLVSSREARDYGDRITRAPAAGFISKDRLSGPALRSLVGGG